jgi:23S rRNA (cytosine1962-C5)-methyltransferase
VYTQVVAEVRGPSPWIFSNQVKSPLVRTLPPGGAVEVRDPRGRLIGHGFANPHSLICIRLLGRDVDVDSVGLYRDRLRAALSLRERALPGRRSLRLVHGEADGLPGLVIDRYERFLTVQVNALGMEHRLPLLAQAVAEVLQPEGALLRNDSAVRELEGLPLEVRTWLGEVPAQVEFDENGVRYSADLHGGQKTGFFFDQADNRRFAAERASGLRVLDLYAHLGGWGLSAALAGAREVVCVDASAAAVAAIDDNARRNGLADRVRAVRADARAWLEAATQAGERFDLVCVDPPAFAKSRKSAGAALPAYQKVNQLAARLVAQGGLLFSSSCSHHIEAGRFEAAVIGGVERAGRSAVILRRAGQAPDHPVHPHLPESAYLKHLVLGLD